jgi:hypothetical protein
MFKFSYSAPLRFNWLIAKQCYLRTEFKPSTVCIIQSLNVLISLLPKSKPSNIGNRLMPSNNNYKKLSTYLRIPSMMGRRLQQAHPTTVILQQELSKM